MDSYVSVRKKRRRRKKTMGSIDLASFFFRCPLISLAPKRLFPSINRSRFSSRASFLHHCRPVRSNQKRKSTVLQTRERNASVSLDRSIDPFGSCNASSSLSTSSPSSTSLPLLLPPPPLPTPLNHRVELLLVWLLLISTVVATFFVQRHRIAWLPPAAAAMLLGVAAGGVVRLSGLAAPLRFSPSAFFYGLLPPIVFAAGVTLKKRSFFANIGTVLLFAVVGTAISTLVFGLATYFLVLLRVVKRKHLGPQPLIECMLFGKKKR